MSVQGLVNAAIGAAAGAVTTSRMKAEREEIKKTDKEIKAEKLATAKEKHEAATEVKTAAQARREAVRAASDLQIAKAAWGQEKLAKQKQKAVRGQPSLADVQAAQQAATEQVSTRAAAITTARENMAKQREMIAQVNRADLIRELRQGGYISGRQAKRVIYNLEKGGASNGTIKH